MIYGTHNSLTSYKVKNWWYKLINFTSKCQNKTIKEQLDAGCRYFDIRLRYYKGKLYAAHGLMIYDITFEDFLREITTYDTEDAIYYRVLYEDAIGFNNAIDYEQFQFLVLTYAKQWPKSNIVLTEIMSKVDQSKRVAFKEVDTTHAYYYKGISKLLGIPYPALTADITKEYIKYFDQSKITIIDFL